MDDWMGEHENLKNAVKSISVLAGLKLRLNLHTQKYSHVLYCVITLIFMILMCEVDR